MHWEVTKMWTIQSNARISLYEKFHHFSVFVFFLIFKKSKNNYLLHSSTIWSLYVQEEIWIRYGVTEIYTTQKGLNTVGAHLTKW